MLEDLMPHNLKIYCKVSVIKIVWNWYKARCVCIYTYKWSKTECTETDPHNIWAIDFQHKCLGNSVGEKTVFSTNGAKVIKCSYSKVC